MKSMEFGRSLLVSELKGEVGEGCLNMCGICPTCVFSPKSLGSAQRQWRSSDEFKRKFMMELVLRCRSVHVLENIRSMLSVTSWTLHSYLRAKRPGSSQGRPSDRTRRVPDGKPLGTDMTETLHWFDRSHDWIKTRYLCHLMSLCDAQLIRMVSNLTSILLVRQRRQARQGNEKWLSIAQPDQEGDEDSEDPALMVVPGSLTSLSGVSRYCDFINCLPVDLSKRILGLLDEPSLKYCQKVCRYWQHVAQETIEEIKFKRKFQDKIKSMMKMCSCSIVSPTHANILEVPIPVKDDEEVDIRPGVQKVRPFEAAYANVKTKMVKMEERNVYCGAYFTSVLLNKEDPHRVVDYRGGSYMAVGSKDCTVHLIYVGSDSKVVTVMKGHVGSIRAVLLCPDRDMVITASCDASIRCWNLKTDMCVMVMYGHTTTVNCLDVHADRLVSGGKDCLVKVWSLKTGENFKDFNFKHHSSVQCVKISTRNVYSSCDKGLIKIWDMESASVLRVIDAHKSSVKCLFFDECHFVSGDCNGQVMAWNINGKECLMTFSHPREVKSLTLAYLRLVTGCADGKIRIFNFLTGDCLREIKAEVEPGQIRSLHFNDTSILVNTKSCVKRYQFAKVYWDYKDSSEGIPAAVSEKSATSQKKVSFTSAGARNEVETGRKMQDFSNKKPERAELPYLTGARALKQSPQSHGCEDQPQTGNTPVPILKRAASQNTANSIQDGAQPHSPGTYGAIRPSSTEELRDPDCRHLRLLPNPEYSMKSRTNLPWISPVDPFREQAGFRLLTVSELDDYEQELAKRDN